MGAPSVFDALWSTRRAVLFDGGLATELERRGADLSDALWSARLLLDDPGLVRDVHEAYLRAGADVVTTASYQASRAGFARRGLDATAADGLFQRSVELAREAIARTGGRGLVAGSLGPHGATLADGSEYRGDTALTEQELADFHRPRMEALWSAGPDLVLFETIPSLREVRAIARLARERPEVPVMVSCSAVTARGIAHGEPLGDVARVLEAVPSVLSVGVNCAPPAYVESLVREVRGSSLARSAMPNRGERWDASARAWVGQDEREGDFDAGAWTRAYLAAGARVLGGCCRTRPEDVSAMRRVIDAR